MQQPVRISTSQYRLELAPGRIKELEAERDWELEKLEERKQKEIEALYVEKRVMDILTELLREHFLQVETPLKGRKVFLDPQQFDLHHSVLELADRSAEGGYIRSGIAWRIPDDAKFVRFFVYWNDPERVDLDLHAVVRDLHNSDMHVGWDGEYCINGAVHSGDITNSDAAEYVDIDLAAPIREVGCNIHLYDGKEAFRDVQTCYVGMMAVDKTDQEVQHYDPANCFFTHELTFGTDNLFYGFVDVLNRCVRFVGLPNADDWDSMPKEVKSFSLQNYLDCVLDGQQVQRVDSAEEAEVVLTMGKSLHKKGISLTDSNFFLEC